MEFRLIVVLASMCLLPGWAFLALSGTWRCWVGLQRWIVAVSLSIAFYPIFFYGLRFILPWLTLGPYKVSALLLVFVMIIVWKLRGDWRQIFTLNWMEIGTIIILGLTLFTRIWFIRDHPYPAWSDSLHHVLLTHLTAVNGQLPLDMEPYFPIPLGQYHLGLYALAAPVQWLAQVPAYTALLWTAQVLNGLCGLGVYFVLDRNVGRWAGVIGALTVGLLSHQPAFYVNWGRFTQVSSQTVLLVACWMTVDVIAMWQHSDSNDTSKLGWHIFFVSLLNAAVFTLHFTVALFYLCLLGLLVAKQLWIAARHKCITRVSMGIMLIAILSLVWVTPVLWPALKIYVANRTRDITQLVASSVIESANKAYFTFDWQSFYYLTVYPWLLIVLLFCFVIGLIRRNELVIVVALWVVLLFLIGNLYILGIRILKLTNLGAVLVMLYLPIGIVIGSGLYELGRIWQTASDKLRTRLMLVGIVGLGCFAAYDYVSDLQVYDNVEPYRFFVTPDDMTAMAWIRENTPEDALFAVNTYFWLPNAPHGTDAGYWIPYFTGRKTTVGVMLNHLGDWSYQSHIVEMSRYVEEISKEPQKLEVALEALYDFGVDFIYIGKQGNFSGAGLNVAQLDAAADVTLVYERDGVSIFQVCP
ncbi:MAG: hypothetical protein JXA33_02130 [Anaerolineae bacterium]|nr:hypothetical protein [Anaerolineae bacterium]